MLIRIALLLFLFLFSRSPLLAVVQPNSLFTDNMVLQRDQAVPIWGTAGPNEEITAQFAGQSVKTRAVNGKWSVNLQPMSANSTAADLTISGENTVTIKNVLVGEVWLCSGQSNMERQLGPRPPQPLIDDWEKEASTADFPQIREFFVPEKGLPSPASDANGKWVVCSSQTAAQFSAVSFFFARALFSRINVPIGLLFSAVGGTPAEAWTSHAALAGQPDLDVIFQAYDKGVQAYPAKLADYQQHQAEIQQRYNDAVAKAVQENKPPPGKPGPPKNPASDLPSRHFNAMISPLIPYAMRGVIWYQGEANSGRGKQYQTLFPLLISDWRQRWNEGNFPFLFVQLAPYVGNSPELREAQLLTFKNVANTAMVVTTDIGDPTNVHPPHKAPVGERLAQAARALAYGEKIEYSGPIYDSNQIVGNAVVISFTHVGDGLIGKESPLTGFQIAGINKKFFPADATIEGNIVKVLSTQISNPAYVRYGWSSTPQVNLFNKNGLPASPFRTDSN